MFVPTLIFSFLLHTCLSSADLSPCFFANKTWLSDDISDILPNIADHTHCQETCLHSTSCSSFTWFTSQDHFSPMACVHFKTVENQTSCSNCISGPFTCTCSTQASCNMEEDNLIDYIPGVQKELDCKDICKQEGGCNMYTWHDHTMAPTHTCLLFSSCESMDGTCTGCFSGPPDCSDIQKKDVLLLSPSLILDLPSFSPSSCTVAPHPIPRLTGAVSMLLEQDLILVCGGHDQDNQELSELCYSSSQGTKWISQPGLNDGERTLSAVSRDSRGWMVTGGMEHDRMDSTEIMLPNGSWVAGPTLPEPIYGHCQVSTGTHTFVVGGLYTDSMLTLNISSPSWSPLPHLPTLREYPTCVLHNNEIWVMGKQALEMASGTDIFSLEDWRWRKGPDIPIFMPKGLEYQGDLYLFGGMRGEPILKLANQGDAWEEIGKIPSSSFPSFMSPVQVYQTFCK